jgi:hypothetical protein
MVEFYYPRVAKHMADGALHYLVRTCPGAKLPLGGI